MHPVTVLDLWLFPRLLISMSPEQTPQAFRITKKMKRALETIKKIPPIKVDGPRWCALCKVWYEPKFSPSRLS